jgi:hypothetical protein
MLHCPAHHTVKQLPTRDPDGRTLACAVFARSVNLADGLVWTILVKVPCDVSVTKDWVNYVRHVLPQEGITLIRQSEVTHPHQLQRPPRGGK